MEGIGPVSMDVAKLMTESAPSMYRLLVDPITNQPIEAGIDCYRISKSLRLMLQVRDEYCQFPGCYAKASTSEVDHMRAFAAGGKSTPTNLEHLCHRHHILKHFKDDKDRHGIRRALNEPDREGIRLRGWTPSREDDGRVSWTSPTGRYCPPASRTEPGPAYPQWLKEYLEAITIIESFTAATTIGNGTNHGTALTEADIYTPEEEDDRDDERFDPNHLPEPPEEFLIDFDKNGWQEITNTTLNHQPLE
ncbi:hypothetical protein CVS30_17715 [Arthrobacter psychrolactophilus]|uniref:HNH nuclease domain-containing protein n=2 Tax=Arthrobacter psychrolactophilus TaxID=92442 RepID=A0A2V5JD33_9MICC|nr:hypothetical protein CVS30_17715 [Arthrobacter psychrolactophilus]